MSGPSHWDAVAWNWARMGPPLRPPAEALDFCARALARFQDRPLRGLVLGATPEYWSLPWPTGSEVLAVDRSQAVLDAVWPGPLSSLRRADWRALPLPPASQDLALCDGGLQVLPRGAGQRAMAAELARVLAPGGLLCLRLYTLDGPPEAPETVLADLRAGRVPDLNHLKLRLWMALGAGAPGGLRLGDLWDWLRRAEPDPAALEAVAGWAPGDLAVLDSYHGSDERYYLDPPGAAEALFCADPGGFELLETQVPDHALGRHCPSLLLRRLGA